MVSAMERCLLYMSTIKRFLCETMTVILSVIMNIVRYKEVSGIKHVRYREVPLYHETLFLFASLELCANFDFFEFKAADFIYFS